MIDQRMVTVKKPSNCSSAELQDFAYLVLEGGEVTDLGLEERIRKAQSLVFLTEGNSINGIAAVKKPALSYRRGVFRHACLRG